MKLIETIKNQIGRWQLNKEIAARKIPHNRVLLPEAAHIGILYNAATKENEKEVQDYANELKGSGKKVFLMGYVNEKNLPANKKFMLNAEFFWKEKLNGFNLPVKGKIGSFLEIHFDLLLNLYLEPLLPLQAMSAYSNAKYRVGANMQDGVLYYDTMIDIAPSQDLRFLIQQIDFYLKVIK